MPRPSKEKPTQENRKKRLTQSIHDECFGDQMTATALHWAKGIRESAAHHLRLDLRLDAARRQQRQPPLYEKKKGKRAVKRWNTEDKAKGRVRWHASEGGAYRNDKSAHTRQGSESEHLQEEMEY